MKQLNGNKMRLLVVGIVAATMLSGRLAKADYIWARKADMPTWRYGHSTSVVGGKIYAFGGDVSLTRVDEYDPATDTWTRKTDMPTARGDTCTCVVNEKIYVMGGGGGPSEDAIAIVEVYDPATDTWAEQTEIPTPRGNPVLGVVDGIIYVIGSKNGRGSEWADRANIVEAYDPSTDTWMRKTDMPTSRWMHSGCVINGKVYVIGGWDNSRYLSAVEEYDPMTDTWMVKAPMPTARCSLDTSVVNGKICAIGGYRGVNAPLSTVEVYDPVTDTWTKQFDIPVPTDSLSTSVVDGIIYVMGGYASGADTSAVYASEVIVDLNGDGIVDAADMCIMVEYWGTDYSLCDIAPLPFGDAIVDMQDLLVLTEYLEPIDTLIAHWALDETEGITAHDSVSGNDDIIMGDPLWQPTGGKVDGALELDGVTNCIIPTTGPNPAEGPFSIFMWIKGGAPGQVIISQPLGSNWLEVDADGMLMTELKASGSGPPILLSQAVITDDQWHHIGLVWDGSQRMLCADGVVVAEDTPDGLAPSAGGLYIGVGNNWAAGSFFSGLIDDVRIYRQALGAEDIAALAQ